MAALRGSLTDTPRLASQDYAYFYSASPHPKGQAKELSRGCSAWLLVSLKNQALLSLSKHTPPLLHDVIAEQPLKRKNFRGRMLNYHIRYFERQLPTVVGNIDKLRELAEQTSRRWIKGMGVLSSLIKGC